MSGKVFDFGMAFVFTTDSNISPFLFTQSYEFGMRSIFDFLCQKKALVFDRLQLTKKIYFFLV